VSQGSRQFPSPSKVFCGGFEPRIQAIVKKKRMDSVLQMRDRASSHGEGDNRVFLGMTAIVASECMTQVMSQVERIARSNASVLITGESGSGKEMIARAVHHYSLRTAKPWVDLSCAALPEQLLESELFGHEKGAFSGADTAKPGLFELAHTGTIFLDEIAELDPRMQVKLLRVLDGVPYYRLGGVKKVAVDVRVVAATNQNLERAVEAGRFRSDLYHRLSQVTVAVPPLRERKRDIAPLAKYFLAQHDPGMTLSPGAMASLEAHSWPGNIRELRNTVVHAAVLVDGPEVGAGDLHFRTMGSPVDSISVRRPDAEVEASLDGMERRMIFEALAKAGGHQQRAADQLGISRRTLSRKLKSYQSGYTPEPVGPEHVEVA
jgi:transcriptional regulator with PAS, ATPase and Fis domain